MKILYTAHGSATGGREGQAATDTGNVKLVLNTPKELGGCGGDAGVGQGECVGGDHLRSPSLCRSRGVGEGALSARRGR